MEDLSQRTSAVKLLVKGPKKDGPSKDRKANQEVNDPTPLFRKFPTPVRPMRLWMAGVLGEAKWAAYGWSWLHQFQRLLWTRKERPHSARKVATSVSWQIPRGLSQNAAGFDVHSSVKEKE
jgi:hypothetical protein